MTGPDFQCCNETLEWHRLRAGHYWQAAAAASDDRLTRDHWAAHARWHEARADKILAAMSAASQAKEIAA